VNKRQGAFIFAAITLAALGLVVVRARRKGQSALSPTYTPPSFTTSASSQPKSQPTVARLNRYDDVLFLGTSWLDANSDAMKNQPPWLGWASIMLVTMPGVPMRHMKDVTWVWDWPMKWPACHVYFIGEDETPGSVNSGDITQLMQMVAAKTPPSQTVWVLPPGSSDDLAKAVRLKGIAAFTASDLGLPPGASANQWAEALYAVMGPIKDQ
jgi:hypothetical protein